MTEVMKMILVVGSGFLGSYVLKRFSQCTDEKILGTYRNEANIPAVAGVDFIKCDVTDKNDLLNLSEKCRGEQLTVFYFSACHNIDYLYQHPEEAEKINITALENFFGVMPQIDKLFFASTDCVYGEDGGKRLSESSPLRPVNVYGEQKKRAENIVISRGFTAVRLPFMLGPSLSAKKHFYDNIINKLSAGEESEMIDGLYRSVLSYEETADALYRLSLLPKEKLPPAVNVCGDRLYSKYETGLAVALKNGLDPSPVKKISEKEGEKFFRDKRASSSDMDNSLLKSLLGIEKLEWQDGKYISAR